MSVTVTLDIDGPRDHEYVLEVAETLPEAIRVLNHLTMTHGAIRYPAEADRIIRHLSIAASHLPQFLGQLSGWLEGEQAAGRLEMHGGDYDGHPDLAQAAAKAHLKAAATLAVRLQEMLEAVAHITTDMAASCAGEDEDNG